MSVRKRQSEAAFKVAMLCGLIVGAGTAAADDAEPPDLEFLEYLGSWEESDEEWLLFKDAEARTTAGEDTTRDESASDGAPESEGAGKESTELQHER
jgi:hypothetical protein